MRSKSGRRNSFQSVTTSSASAPFSASLISSRDSAAAPALAGAQVVVDVANAPSWKDNAVLAFFETSGRNLLAAEAVVISDSAMFAPGQPSILSSLRGLAAAAGTAAFLLRRGTGSSGASRG